MKEAPCCVSLQVATKYIALIHGVFVVLTFCCVAYTTISLAPKCNSDAVDYPMPMANVRELYRYFGVSSEKEEPIDSYTIKHNGETYYSEKHVKKDKVLDSMTIRLVAMMTMLVILGLDYQLYIGSVEKNKHRCGSWALTICIIFTFAILFLMPMIVFALVPDVNVWFYLGLGSKVVAVVYVLWIVYSFMGQTESSGCSTN